MKTPQRSCSPTAGVLLGCRMRCPPLPPCFWVGAAAGGLHRCCAVPAQAVAHCCGVTVQGYGLNARACRRCAAPLCKHPLALQVATSSWEKPLPHRGVEDLPAYGRTRGRRSRNAAAAAGDSAVGASESGCLLAARVVWQGALVPLHAAWCGSVAMPIIDMCRTHNQGEKKRGKIRRGCPPTPPN